MAQFDWKGTIGKVVPWLAGMLGGPAAGVGAKLICDAVGLDPSPENAQKAAEMVAAGALTGDQFLALKKAEQEAQLKAQELGYQSIKDLEALVVDDRKDARNREIQIKDKTPAIGFYAITVGFFGLLGCMLFHVIPTGNERVLDVMVGSLGTAWIGAVNYYYGSSRSSQSKDQMIYNSTPTGRG